MKIKLFLLTIAALATTEIQARAPRLVVNIVVGSMRSEDLDRYAVNFSQGGFKRLIEGGTRYNDARYDYQQTTTPVSLATLSTGALPSTHGIIASSWIDYVVNKPVNLIDDQHGPGPSNLIAPTLTETLLRQYPGSNTVTVAAEAESAVVLNGVGGQAYWLDPTNATWSSSPHYIDQLPDWIEYNNRERFNSSYLNEWRTVIDRDKYLNFRNSDITLTSKKQNTKSDKARLKHTSDYEKMLYTPFGNTAVLGLAKELIVRNQLGEDAIPDLLNICLDSSRRIAEAYGPESIEVEDSYYRLDRDLSDFLTFLFAQVKSGEVVIVLTSDHGTSASYDNGPVEADRFNVRQFEVIANGFLNVRYGSGNWVSACINKCVYLNHNLIYERGLDLAAVQNEVAIFAMQFRGVSHALSATAMRSSYFGSGYARKMQNSFYPRRSGDVVLNLMPGWIEESKKTWSSSGSMYGYDTQVPLIFYGWGTISQSIKRRVDMTSIAPTLARLMDISEPAASEGAILAEIAE